MDKQQKEIMQNMPNIPTKIEHILDAYKNFVKETKSTYAQMAKEGIVTKDGTPLEDFISGTLLHLLSDFLSFEIKQLQIMPDKIFGYVTLQIKKIEEDTKIIFKSEWKWSLYIEAMKWQANAFGDMKLTIDSLKEQIIVVERKIKKFEKMSPVEQMKNKEFIELNKYLKEIKRILVKNGEKVKI